MTAKLITSNKSEIARTLGVSRQRLSKHLQKPDAPQPDKEGRWDVVEVGRFIAEQRRASNASGHGKVSDARVAKLETETKILELKLGELDGSLVKVSEVEQVAARCATAIRNDLLAIPGKVSGQLEGLRAGEISVILNEAICDCLRHLSETEE